jgi:monoamine oxidase
MGRANEPLSKNDAARYHHQSCGMTEACRLRDKRHNLTRRRAIAVGAAAGASAMARFSHAGQRFDTEVVIIGAGAAGLAAASVLQSQALAFIHIEARDRIGGRTFTATSLGQPYDAGAIYIHWAERNPWRDIATSFGFVTQVDSSDPPLYYDGARRPSEGERKRRRRSFEILNGDLNRDPAAVADVSFVESVRDEGSEVVVAAGDLARMELGEEPERVSALDYARLWSGDDLLVPAGYGTLVARFGAGLTVKLETPATSIDWAGPGVGVETARGTIRARAAILTLPVGVLAAEAIRFRPPLPEATLGGIAGLGMGALTKIVLRFDGERFGIPAANEVLERVSERAIFDFDCFPFDRDLVIAYLGGDHARQVAMSGERSAIESALDAFVTVVGSTARQHFVGGRLHAWSEDPFSRGSYSHARPGHADARAKLAIPVGDRLFFAGEATGGGDGFGDAMTAGGAYRAGIAAAQAVQRVLR